MRLFINRNNNFSYKNSPCKPIEASLVNQNESSIFDFDDFRAISARESSIFLCLTLPPTRPNAEKYHLYCKGAERGEKKKNVYRHKICVRKERWKAQVSGKSKLEVADESHHGLILLAHVIDHLTR